MKYLILLSGGLDSTTLLYETVGEHGPASVQCLLIDYQQQHVQELSFAVSHARRLGVLYTKLELPVLGGLTDESWIVPNRNAILIEHSVNHALKLWAKEKSRVLMGCNRDDADYFPDCRPEFFAARNLAIKAAGNGQVQAVAPYVYLTKWQIAGRAREYGVPTHELWSCYRGGAKPCGECPACVKLAAALA